MQNIALGTVQFGQPYGIANNSGQVSIEEIEMILEYAQKKGVDTLDTAINYGESETLLGSIGVSNWNVITKISEVPIGCDNIYNWISSSVSASLKRLKINCLSGILLHKPEQLLFSEGDKIYSALNKLKEEGCVKKIGISIYDPIELDKIISRFPLDIVQAPFNIMDQRLISSGWLSKLYRSNIDVHVRSVFLQGLLLMNSSERPQVFNRWESIWIIWNQFLCESKLSALQVCIRYALLKKEINRVIVGVDSLKQLRQVLDAVSGNIPEIPSALSCNDLDLINPSRWKFN